MGEVAGLDLLPGQFLQHPEVPVLGIPGVQGQQSLALALVVLDGPGMDEGPFPGRPETRPQPAQPDPGLQGPGIVLHLLGDLAQAGPELRILGQTERGGPQFLRRFRKQ